MSRYYDPAKQDLYLGAIARDVVLVLVVLIASAMYGCPQYSVWQQGLHGQGELARAVQNRQIRIQEAHAQEEAAKSLANAEVERAKGVAQANQIIGESLKNNETYLRYLWLHSLEGKEQKTVIYIPTEANLPILEANRHAGK